eukprot:1152943-Pleurochrysis_carterae.AAC.1
MASSSSSLHTQRQKGQSCACSHEGLPMRRIDDEDCPLSETTASLLSRLARPPCHRFRHFPRLKLPPFREHHAAALDCDYLAQSRPITPNLAASFSI